VIGHEEGNAAAGMGIRESDTPITGNTSRFVPHLFGPETDQTLSDKLKQAPVRYGRMHLKSSL
jgi:hypothetical protein